MDRIFLSFQADWLLSTTQPLRCLRQTLMPGHFISIFCCCWKGGSTIYWTMKFELLFLRNWDKILATLIRHRPFFWNRVHTWNRSSEVKLCTTAIILRFIKTSEKSQSEHKILYWSEDQWLKWINEFWSLHTISTQWL